MKIYTKGGDNGLTSLFGGKRLSKDDFRIEAYGTIDELNSFTGLLMAKTNRRFFHEVLTMVQNRLFDIGSHLASDPEKSVLPCHVDEIDITMLEETMDVMDTELPALRSFILPGGSELTALAHVCRTVCRRAERRVVSLAREENVDEWVIIFLNRLSDFFFVLARYTALKEGVEEIKWSPKNK